MMYNKKPLLRLMSGIQSRLLLAPKTLDMNISCMDCISCISVSTKITRNGYAFEYKCTQFKTETKNKITKIITYDNISECRNDENKCGKSAKYFIPFRNLY